MNLTCPKCRSAFEIDTTQLNDEAAQVECPNCRHQYVLALEAAASPAADTWPAPDDESPPDTPDTDTFHYQGEAPAAILQKVFGYKTFRGLQADIIDSVVQGDDVFALMPTGSGKSICYQIPALIRPGVGIIISPLIALMQDQVDDLRQNNVNAAFLNSSLTAAEAARVEARLTAGTCDLLYVAPERLATNRFRRLLERIPVALFAIDEAHCVSQWGHDFRPEYLKINDVTRCFPDVPRIALTATADNVTREDIINKLDLPRAHQFVAGFDRPNITYQVRLKKNGKQQLLNFIRTDHAGQTGIVYVRTRKRADDISDWLQTQGIAALPYHAGLEPKVRAAHQQRFIIHDGVVMVATVAFGMGIDKPDVRFVAHLDMPASMEAYYQETGRAGRDGAPANAWMVYSLSDVVAMRKLLAGSDGNDAFKKIQQRKLGSLLGFCEAATCRRETLLRYFGQTYPAPCNTCDNCNHPIETWDGTIAAQKALSCVYRTGQRFGAAYLIDVLRGKANDRIKRFGHNRIKTFGVGEDLSQDEWFSVFRQLLAAGLLDTDLAAKAGFRLNKAAWAVLKGEQTVRLRKDPIVPKTAPSRKKAKRTPVEPEFDMSEPSSQLLWESLRQLRLELARENNLPPYLIFHDKTLKEMVVHRPATKAQMLQISGVGESKLDKYGDLFLKAIQAENNIDP